MATDEEETYTMEGPPYILYDISYVFPVGAVLGKPYKFTVNFVRRSEEPVVSWFRGERKLESGSRLCMQKTETTASLEFLRIEKEDEGMYFVRADTSQGYCRVEIKLIVLESEEPNFYKRARTMGDHSPDKYGVHVTSKDSVRMQHPKSGVILRVPLGAVPEGVKATINCQIHTDLSRRDQDLEPDHVMTTPIAEYTTDEPVRFLKPVEITLPHCLASGTENIKAYNTSSKDGKRKPIGGDNPEEGGTSFQVEERVVRIKTYQFK